jgi:hypothetical protein
MEFVLNLRLVQKIRDLCDQKYLMDNDLSKKDPAKYDPALANNDHNLFQTMITYVA